MKKLLILLMVLTSGYLTAQDYDFTPEEQAVYEVIIQLFDGMREGDSSKVHRVFSDEVRMYSNFEDQEGRLQVSEGSLEQFLQAVGTPHDEIWDEKIWNTSVNVDMGIAQVWTDYAFYRGEEFSHCGIDAFQLINDNGWKIIHLMDTRKKMNCEKPK